MFGSHKQSFVVATVAGVVLASLVMAGGADDERPRQAREGRQSPVNHARILEVPEGTTDQSRLPSMEASARIEIIGKKNGARITIIDPDGEILFESDPTQNVTTIAKDSRIPSVTVRESANDDDDVMELRVTTPLGAKNEPPAVVDGPSPQNDK
jgi:hypothetical protein